jgi:hypothetical protein
MFKQFDKVKVVHPTRIINDEMKTWIDEHKDQVFKVERYSVMDEAVKLYKVNFWVTEDLLEKVE